MDRASERRRQILEFIRRFIAEKGYSPTIREIREGCGIPSTLSVQLHLEALEREGRIRREREVFRSIRLVEGPPAEGVVAVPVLGVIAAGEPIPVPDSEGWASSPEEVLKLPAEWVRNRERVFALRVKGDSMVDALIADGDLVLLQAVPVVENGEVVAVWLREEQEVTLKKVYYEGDRVRLQPANPRMAPISTPAENVQVQGRLLAVIREYR